MTDAPAAKPLADGELDYLRSGLPMTARLRATMIPRLLATIDSLRPSPTASDVERAREWLEELDAVDLDDHPAVVTSLASLLTQVRADATQKERERRDERQRDVHSWCSAAFGTDQASSVPQRGLRHGEEAIEAMQSAGCERAIVHKLVDYIFDRPPGDLRQEIGGSGLTLLALAQAAGISADDAECTEIARVKAKPLEHFAKRNRVKNDAGFIAAAIRSETTS